MWTTDRTATSAIPERPAARALLLAACALVAACEGDRGPAGPASDPGDPGGDDGTVTRTAYAVGEEVPALVVRIDDVAGASGPGGEFLPGDVVTVAFSLEKESGEAWVLGELTEGQALVSGPTFNYQRVLPAVADVLDAAVGTGPGTFRYTFAVPLPASYPAPYNDTPAFGPNDAELQGRALLDGTYSVGLSFTWDFTVEGRPFRRVGEATLDFVLGTGAGPLTARAVTTQAHCDRCHGELQAHDGRYRKLELCLMCHTSGAEDANLPDVVAGTPGVTIDSRVLFHKLHTGRFLPSVVGMTTLEGGMRDYGVAPRPLRYARADGSLRDFSHVGFPVMPTRSSPMPRDLGYEALLPEEQAKEDLVLSGPTECDVCHGDPDGAGPLETPPQANLIRVPSRRACAACHDDWVPTLSYTSNGQTMPPQLNDIGCNACHDSRFPGPLSPPTAHTHPSDEPDLSEPFVLALLAVEEAPGASDLDGTLDPGEALEIEFTLRDEAGGNVAPRTLDELRLVIAGPTDSFQVLLDTALPHRFGGLQPFRMRVPEAIDLEYLGDSTGALDTFVTRRFPHRSDNGAETEILARTGLGAGSGALLASARRGDGFLDVLGAGTFAPGNVVVVDDGVPGREEYLRVRRVEGERLWFTDGRPASGGLLRADHDAGAAVAAVLLTTLTRFQVAVDPASGTVSETLEVGAGRAVLARYTTDWRVPAEYPEALNGSNLRGERNGAWTGKPLVPGTYTAALAGSRAVDFTIGLTTSSYRATSPGTTVSFLVGDAVDLVPHARVPDPAACDRCHVSLRYHGTWEGFASCILCHGASGTEDLTRAVAAGAPETPGVSVEFRELLHRIHTGRAGGDDTHEVVARDDDAPEGWTTRSYHELTPLPAFPGRTLECARCHGEGNVDALLPSDRGHPTAQLGPVSAWRPACVGCHSGEAAVAHVESNTAPSGAEACAICHDPGEFEDVLRVHGGRVEPR